MKLPSNSKPWHLLRLLLAKSTRRTFWYQVLQRCRLRCCASRAARQRHQPAIGVADDTRETDQLQIPTQSIPMQEITRLMERN